MYTQCPQCDVAFRVTAEVLKMAAGQVRCGGCGVAFNALEHLSETKPVARQKPDPDPPQLSPDEPGELTADTPPESISAEQSAALLKTLDDLTGEDIRIEDTGVEWRVIGNDPEEPDSDGDAYSDSDSGRESSPAIDEMLFDDNTVLPDDFDAVVDAHSQPLAVEPPPVLEPEAPQVDLDLSEPDEWEDLLGDLVEAEERGDEREAKESGDEWEAAELDEASGLPDDEYEEAPEAIEIELTDDYAVAGDEFPGPDTPPGPVDDTDTDEDLETSIEEDLFAAAFKNEAAARADQDSEPDHDESTDDFDDFPEEVEIDLQPDEDFESEDIEDIAMPFDDDIEQTIATLSMSLNEEIYKQEADAEDELDGIDLRGDAHSEADESAEEPPGEGDLAPDEPEIPEMSEEEKTINMLIDEELLSIAVEDEDGFASTIVQLQPDDKVEKEISAKESANKDDSSDADDEGEAEGARDPLSAHGMAVETIIMEGEHIRAELGSAALEENEASDEGDDGLSLNRDKDDYERRREMTSHHAGKGTYAAIALLALLLVVQVVHQSRAALATVPAFNAAVGPIYRMLGMPLTPAWNIGGWRFEATKGDTDEDGNALTIYSRVGNNSDDPLPYPLVHVSLTDRFEDIIGSKILEPIDYLPENTDSQQLVRPGDTFNAVIAIDSPSPDATGFKLNVCYRLAGDQLRCADQDFK